ncbi:hypothetical protein [Streptomyces sp. STR69]|nr:hypothetical protein [Streptomyces sp. STR69]
MVTRTLVDAGPLSFACGFGVPGYVDLVALGHTGKEDLECAG